MPPIASTGDRTTNGLRALRLLTEHLASDPASQASHRYKRTNRQYIVEHDPEDCPTCSWLAAIEDALLFSEDAAPDPLPSSEEDAGVGNEPGSGAATKPQQREDAC